MKMKQIIFGLAIGLISTACSSETKTAEDTSTNETSEYHESENEENTFAYNLLEDYAQLDTKSKLYDAFDPADIKEDTTWMAEGTVQVVYSELVDTKANNTVRFYWEENAEDLFMVEVDYILYDQYYSAIDSQRVESECGLYTGMTLDKLVDLNEGNFEFSGFGWDYGGMVFFKEDDKLQKCNLSVHLSYDYHSFSDNLGDLMGDRMVNTEEAVTKEVPIFIDRMSISVGELDF